MSENVFTMAGDVGDLVYALPAVRALGGGHLALWPRPYVREPFSPSKVEKVASFFASQSYILTVQFNGGRVAPTFNLDDFRSVWLKLRRQGAHLQYNLSELFLLTFDLPLRLAQDKWLTIDPGNAAEAEPTVIFSRSFRYRNPQFPWKDVWEKYKNIALFLGTTNEYHEFIGNVGAIRHIATPTLLEAARLISACKLFVGNQNALMAVAIGLQVPKIIQETWMIEPNCLFPCVTPWLKAPVELPDL